MSDTRESFGVFFSSSPRGHGLCGLRFFIRVCFGDHVFEVLVILGHVQSKSGLSEEGKEVENGQGKLEKRQCKTQRKDPKAHVVLPDVGREREDGQEDEEEGNKEVAQNDLIRMRLSLRDGVEILALPSPK